MPDLFRELEQTLQARKRDRPEGSYTVTLLDDTELAQRKIMEEAFELCLELGRTTHDSDPERIAEEAADLIYHTLVGLVSAGVSLDAIEQVLQSRQR